MALAKDWNYADVLAPFSIVSTSDHDLHRGRRNALNSFFSVASVRRLVATMKEYRAKMISRMEQAGETGEIMQMHHVFKACASDVITEYAFTECFGFMNTADFGRAFFESTDAFFCSRTSSASCLGWFTTPERVESTIFEGIFNSSLPPEGKADQRLASEAQLVVFAGESTTAYTLTCCLYQLLANKDEVRNLRSELAAAVPDPSNIELSQVDSLPCLNAITQEAVRLHPGVMAGQVRISPKVPIVYDDKRMGKSYVAPPNTVASMSPLDTHMHLDAFGPDAYEYRPQRWIDIPKLARCFMGFSRGARNWVGQGPTLELYDTIRARDIGANADYIIPVPAKGCVGLRVKIRS
ncbi:hypothetical protein DL768_010736 [Monosporascus sp. mg162]|nr:hypothetical protein DL768_010736 [Monosporascus sp. mg162]